MKVPFGLILAGLLFITSCTKEGSGKSVSIDKNLQTYFETFVEAGAERGITIDYEINGITAVLTRITTPGVVGQCFHNVKQPNSVIFDRDYWVGLDTMEREFLVFHELGHCMLNREHLDAVDNRGFCVSIMHSSVDICPFIYTASTREAYLDELFNP